MPAERIATVVPVAEQDARGKVAEIYNDINAAFQSAELIGRYPA